MAGFASLVGPGLSYAGPDQGIDFTGRGPVLAPDDLKIVSIRSHTGWPGEGTLIVGQFQSGAAKGRYMYAAEDLQPTVSVGAIVPKGSQFALATGSGRAPGIEVGFAQDASGRAYGSIHDGKPGGPTPIFGQAFAKYVQGLAPGNPFGSNTTPSSVINTIKNAPGDAAAAVVQAIADAFSSLFDTVAKHAAYAGLALVAIVGGFVLMSQGAKRSTHAEGQPA